MFYVSVFHSFSLKQARNKCVCVSVNFTPYTHTISGKETNIELEENMKKLLFICFLLLSSLLFSNDFRKVNWGMNKDEVKKAETMEIIQESDDIIAYQTNLAGMQTLLIYIFADNKLTRAKYSIIDEHSNKNDYISDFSKIKELLSKKYGNCEEDETIWKDDLYRDKYSDWGFAVSLGHLIYYAKWNTEKTEILSILSGENYQIKNVIEYSSKALSGKEDEMREKEYLSFFSETGFCSSNWGSSIVEVKGNESAEPLSETDELLAYEKSISGVNAMIGFLFTQKKLTTGRFLFTEEHSNKNDYINDYNTIKELLIKKYGEPKDENTYWKDDLYRDKYSDWGFAISLGHLVYYSSWSTDSSDITIMLSGENYKISHLLEYKSKQFRTLEQQEVEKKNLDDF